MRVVVSGATGTIGVAAVEALRRRGDTVVALSRDVGRGRARLGVGIDVRMWAEPTRVPPPAAALAGADAVVHLLGERVDQRWTARAKRDIRDSRVLSTRLLVEALGALPEDRRPQTLVAQSASGIYGDAGDRPLDEAAPRGDDFLAEVVVAWEHEAQAAEPLLRVVRARTGVVLSPHGGALARMLPFFKAGVGGSLAGGRQYVPWVHLDDVVGAVLRCLDNPQAAGPVNVAAPEPETNAQLAKALGRALGRPAVLPVPALALKALYGEMAQVVLGGQRLVSERLRAVGYTFCQPALEPALRDALSRR